MLEGRWEPDSNILNGRLRLLGSAVVLTRDQSPISPALQLPGLDSRRVSGEADWRATFTSGAGIRFSPFLNARLDAYSLGDLDGVSGRNRSLSRGLITGGADISWPFAKRFNSSTLIIEPVAGLNLPI